MILLAVITAAHGIQGAVKVKTFTQTPESLFSYGDLRDEKGRAYQLKLVRALTSERLIVTVEGVKDRTQAEALRGTKLYVARDQLPALEEEEFYYSDLIGLAVSDLDGQEVGQVKAVEDFGAGPFLEIQDAGHHIYTIPFTKEAVPVVRLSKDGNDAIIQVDGRFLLDSTLPQPREALETEE